MDDPGLSNEPVQSSLPSSLFQRADDAVKGRHLIATDRIARGQLIFIERPLFCLQSLPNIAFNRYICYGCKSFVSTPAAMLLWRCHGNTPNAELEQESRKTCVPCRHACGYVYCSEECEKDTWISHHCILCTGDKEQEHPVVQYKQYAVETNEILLVIAEWWIAQHALFPSNAQDNAYTDFLMNPWWDVVTADMIQDPTEPGAGFVNGELISVHQQLYEVCSTAADLLNRALHAAATTIPQIAALDISRRIGAMEQNAMGIRQRSPLGSPTVWRDTNFRREYHAQIVQCLVEAELLEDQKVEEEGTMSDAAPPNEIASSDVAEKYTPDEIARCLSKLHMNEDGSVFDSNEDGGDPSMARPVYGAEGDDFDILFPPLDGTAMYSMACKMNHSCDPNVILIYRRRAGFGRNYPLVASVVALRDIAAGEEMTISYIDADASYADRQQALRHYGFVCQCLKCHNEKDQISPDENNDEEDDEKDDVSMGDSPDQGIVNETEEGEALLLQRLERLDSAANCSMFGVIPSPCYDPVANFVRQTVDLLRTNHSDLLETVLSSGRETGIIHLLEQCVQAIQDRDYALCKIVGCDLVATVLSPTGAEDWTSLAHRESYFCGVLTVCIAHCHDYDFLSAQNVMDSALRRGLPNQCVERIVAYIRVFAEQMITGPHQRKT
jgi:SET domain